MRPPLLSKYLDPAVLSRVANRRLEPRGLVVGNLAGAHRSPLSGFAVEFAGHREYVLGDDPRHIDWRVYFNRDKYFVKQYELETNFVCHLVVDTSASMQYGVGPEQKWTYATRLATTLAFGIVRQSDKVSLATFDERLRGFVTPSNSPGQLVKMAQHLDQCGSAAKTDLGNCLHEFIGQIGRRELIVILSDFFGDLAGLESTVQRLRYNQHEVVLFPVLHHDELTFELDGLVKFQGLEAPAELLARPDELRQSYLQAVERFLTQLQDIAGRNRCEYFLVDTRRPLAETLIDYLNQRLPSHAAGR
ncbi:MAG: DUF58 domain-containing protein [Pirellulaceae bacterium]